MDMEVIFKGWFVFYQPWSRIDWRYFIVPPPPDNLTRREKAADRLPTVCLSHLPGALINLTIDEAEGQNTYES